jgi:excisionase family DNA binding protein
MANIVTAKEISRYLKLSESTVYKLASAGDLPGFKIGDSWRFDMDRIVSMISGAIEKGMKAKNEPASLSIMDKAIPRRERKGKSGNGD